MFTPKVGIALLICISLAALIVPALATEYKAGVTPGLYVKLGNFTTNDPSLTVYSDMDWIKYEVTAVTANNVTIAQTGAFKNGTVAPNSGTSATFNVQDNTVEGFPATSSPIIAANLNQGDPIPNTTFNVTKTENKNYLGSSRNVNIVEETYSQGESTMTGTFTYDKATGMILEVSLEETNSTTTITASFSVVETNVFNAPSPSSSVPEFPSLLILAMPAIAVIAGLITYKRKRS